MLYPLSYWSCYIAAAPRRGPRGNNIIAAETARLKRASRILEFTALPNNWDSDILHNMG